MESADGMSIPTDYSLIRQKTVLISPTEEQFELLRQRLEDRTQENIGETIFEIGVGEGELRPRLRQLHHYCMLRKLFSSIIDC